MFTQISSFAVTVLALSSNCLAAGPLAVPLGTAANYAILATTKISTVPNSVIHGDIGISPMGSTALVGFGLNMAGAYATSSQVNGKVYASDFESPTPSTLNTAISDLRTAYNDASSRANPKYSNLGAGHIGGLTLSPGLYKWATSVSIASSVTISGSAKDTWIFQVAKNLTIAKAKSVGLAGGASTANIVWVVGGPVSLEKDSVFQGTILGAKSITLNDGSSITGRLLSEDAVALTKAKVTEG